MSEQVSKYLFDIMRAAADAMEFVAGLSFAEYAQSKVVRAAVEREMIIIGEAVVQLRRLDPQILDGVRVDTSSTVGFRNRLVHGYDSVDDAIVFRIATRDLPQLRQDVEYLQSERTE
jgi:uncharacterized protein with HEPN domain